MAKAPAGVIELKPLNIQRIDVPVVGDSSLIVQAWSQKAKQEMLDKQLKKAKPAKAARDLWREFVDSLYWLSPKPDEPTEADVEKGTFGFPAIAFKGASVTAVTTIGSLTKVLVRQCFHIDAEFVQILGGAPSMREDVTKIGIDTSFLRYRGEFTPWAAILPIKYNADVMSAEQVVNLINVGGFGCGVGEWRPERNGVHGRFHVASAREMKAFA
jgi:hypothetical protein